MGVQSALVAIHLPLAVAKLPVGIDGPPAYHSTADPVMWEEYGIPRS